MTPIRTCIGCRGRFSQDRLLRFRRRPDGVVTYCTDRPRSTAGRTAYVCASRRCYELAVSRRAFARALGGPRSRARSTQGGLSVRVESTTLWPSILNGLEQTIQRLVRSGASPHRGRLNSTIRLRDELGVRGKDA